MPIVVYDQRSPEWHAVREGKITASIAAACLGFDEYTSRQKAYRTILGEKATENKHMRWGTEFEATARLEYEVATGNMIEETGFWLHHEFDWLGASPDGMIGDDGLLEIKCPSHVPTSVPLRHRIQMIVQLAVTGRKWCDYFVWAGDKRFMARVYPSGADGIIRRLDEFRKTFVLPKIEPPRKKRKVKS